jgi:uncharacterized protein
MTDVATVAVLQDLLLYGALALVLGLVVYQVLSSVLTVEGVYWRGSVLARPYDWEDLVAALMICAMLTSSVWAAPSATMETTEETLTTASTLSQVTSIAVGGGFILLLSFALLAFMRVLRNLDPGEMFGLRVMKPLHAFGIALVWSVPIFIFITALAYISTEALSGVWHDLSPQEPVKLFQQSSLAVQLTLGFSAVIIAPLAEELIFRGYVYGVLKRFTDGYFAALGSALVFAIVHMHIGTLVPLFVLGLLLVLAYEVTGSLLVAIFIHAIFNASSTALILLGYSE